MGLRHGKRTLLFAEEGLAAQIVPVAQAWVASWLIDPFVLVPVPSRPSGAQLVTRMPASVIGRDGVRELDVFDLLAQGEYELIRFLALQAVEPGRPALDREALIEYAMSLQQASSPVTRFWRLNLMVHPTAVAPERPLDRLVQGWEANVIAAPENRSSDRSFDAFVVAEGRSDYVGHLLGNAATAGAMWCGMDVGPYDERTPAGGAATLVALQRTFVRAVVTDDFLVRVARAGLERLIADESPFDDPVLIAGGHLIAHQVVPEAQLGALVDAMVDVMMQAPPENALSYRMRDRALPITIEPRRVGVGEALRSFGRFSVDKLVTVPRFLFFRGQQRIAARFTRTLHGEDGDARVVLGRDPIGDLGEFVRDLQQADLEKAEVLAQIERSIVDIDFSDAQYREVWSAMRTLSFGMYDGAIGTSRPDSMQGRLRVKLAEAGIELPSTEASASETTLRSLVVPTKSSLFPDWRDPYDVPGDLSALLDDDMAHIAERIEWIAIDDAEGLKSAVDQRGEALVRSLDVAHERRAELLADLEHDLQRHCEIELAQGQITDWLISTEGHAVSAAAVDRLRRALGRLPVSVLPLVEEAIHGPDGAPQHRPAAAAVAAAPIGAAGVEDEPDPEDSEQDHAEQDHAEQGEGRQDEAVLAADASAEFRVETPPAPSRPDAAGDAQVAPVRWWERLRFWRRRPPVDQASSYTFAPDEASLVARTLAELLSEELVRLDDEIEGLRRAEEELEREMGELLARVEHLDEAARPFRAWFARNSHSFAWRLVDRMRRERQALATHVEATRAWLASPLPVSPEEALQLYEAFVRRLRRIFLWGLLIPGAVFLLARTVLSELARDLGDWITSGRIGRFIETDLGRVLADAVRAFLGNPWPYLVSFVVAASLGALIAYYRAWSVRQRKVRQLRSDVLHMRKWVQDLKVERSRLQHLERHSADVLRLMSEFLHRPFIIPSQEIRGRRSGPVGGAESTMSLSVAEPLWDATWQGQHAFESKIVARHARRGWLDDAFRRLGATVEEATGQPRGSFSVERLESSARTRRALLHLIENSERDPRELIGQRIEREMLREMIGWDLSDDLPFPNVAETRVSPTKGVDVRLDLLDDERHGIHPWVDFMLHGLPSGEADRIADEWAPWTISVSASDAVRQDLRTVVHGPARYRRDVEQRRPGSFVPLREEEIRPVELVIRIDHALDRSLSDIRGFEQANGLVGAPSDTDEPGRRFVPTDEDLDV